jgi:hypothetical protein
MVLNDIFSTVSFLQARNSPKKSKNHRNDLRRAHNPRSTRRIRPSRAARSLFSPLKTISSQQSPSAAANLHNPSSNLSTSLFNPSTLVTNLNSSIPLPGSAASKNDAEVAFFSIISSFSLSNSQNF